MLKNNLSNIKPLRIMNQLRLAAKIYWFLQKENLAVFDECCMKILFHRVVFELHCKQPSNYSFELVIPDAK